MCRSGSPARESRWSNAAATSPVDRHLPDAALADAGEGDLPLEEADRRPDRRLVGGLDLAGHLGCGERPQRRHRLHRAEGQVVAGDRRLRRLGRGRDEAGQLGVVTRGAAMRPGEGASDDLGPDAGTLLGRDGCVPRASLRGVVRAEGGGDLLAKGGRLEGGEGSAEGTPAAGDGIRLLGARVPALAEEELHLLLGDDVAVGEVEAGEAAAQPAARRLALLLVVGGEPDLAPLGAVVGSDLPGQVGVPAAGGELVQAHGHTSYASAKALTGHGRVTKCTRCVHDLRLACRSGRREVRRSCSSEVAGNGGCQRRQGGRRVSSSGGLSTGSVGACRVRVGRGLLEVGP